MNKLKFTGWYISSQQFNPYWGWETVMVYIHNDKTKTPEGAWWHEKGEEVNAFIEY